MKAIASILGLSDDNIPDLVFKNQTGPSILISTPWQFCQLHSRWTASELTPCQRCKQPIAKGLELPKTCFACRPGHNNTMKNVRGERKRPHENGVF